MSYRVIREKKASSVQLLKFIKELGRGVKHEALKGDRRSRNERFMTGKRQRSFRRLS